MPRYKGTSLPNTNLSLAACYDEGEAPSSRGSTGQANLSRTKIRKLAGASTSGTAEIKMSSLRGKQIDGYPIHTPVNGNFPASGGGVGTGPGFNSGYVHSTFIAWSSYWNYLTTTNNTNKIQYFVRYDESDDGEGDLDWQVAIFAIKPNSSAQTRSSGAIRNASPAGCCIVAMDDDDQEDFYGWGNDSGDRTLDISTMEFDW